MSLQELIILSNFIGPFLVLIMLILFRRSVKKSLKVITVTQKQIAALQLFMEGNQELIKMKLDTARDLINGTKSVEKKILDAINKTNVNNTTITSDSSISSAGQVKPFNEPLQ